MVRHAAPRMKRALGDGKGGEQSETERQRE
jgi:hypothetical protein